MLAHPNHLLASQALQLLLLATHPDMYDWHKPPGFHALASQASSSNSSSSQPESAEHAIDTGSRMPQSSSSSSSEVACRNQPEVQEQQQTAAVGSSSTSSGSAVREQSARSTHSMHSMQCHPSQGPDGLLWRQLAQLHAGPLLSSLLRLSPDLWPGSGHQALQLLAFYLSWLRAWWCQVSSLWVSAAVLVTPVACWHVPLQRGSHNQPVCMWYSSEPCQHPCNSGNLASCH